MRGVRSRFLSACAVAVVAVSLAVPGVLAARQADAPGGMSAELSSELASLDPGATLPVIAFLRPAETLLEGVAESDLRHAAAVAQAPVLTRLRRLEAEQRVTGIRPLWIVNAIAFTGTSAEIADLAARPDVVRIERDRVYTLAAPIPSAASAVDRSQSGLTIEPNLLAIQAPLLWSEGITGTGAVVASLDTGVDVTHPDLGPRWRGGVHDWLDPYQQCAQPCDPLGHGSRVTGVIVGGAESGSVIGVAPGAVWIAARVFNAQGQAQASAIHQAFQWVLDPDGDPATDDVPDVVNASWDLANPAGCDLTFAPDLQALVAAGITPVFAAGNQGAGVTGVGAAVSPANNPDAFPIGAVDAAGAVAVFSSRGPTSCGVGVPRVFPDVVAPGVAVFTSDHMVFGDPTPRYVAGPETTGTSFAAPHVSGGLALLVSAFPGRRLSPAELRVALAHTAHPVPIEAASPNNDSGAGMIDLWAAYQALAAGVLPTATPTITPSPTPSPRPSATPSSTPTVAPVGVRLYLPWIGRGGP